jgi:signal transduction histidine kinase
VTVRDVTSRKETEAEASRARLAAEAANRAKTDFVARMSHELRTPLNSVIGFANILLKNRRGALDGAEVEYVQRIQGAGTHLLGLINDVLDIAKVEAGRMTLELTMVDVAALVQGILVQFDAQAAASGVDLRLEAPAQGAMLITDVGKLQQVLINLVGNALKFTRHGAVTVCIRDDSDEPLLHDGTCSATSIEVHDTGIGIPPDRLEAIFEAFEQADSSTSRHYGGTGLGLSISRSLCDALGYGLDVASQVAGGSCFTISLVGSAVETGAVALAD